jgi:D-glycero-alpha-D-manno-heptose-7-phosphate kinase
VIIVRSPLRVSLGGGGTDLPSYYREHEGFLIAAAIDKYVYITIYDIFNDDIVLKYSKYERVDAVEKIAHPIIREAFHVTGVTPRAIEISSMADIPAGTGLGSSGSFTTALLKALHAHARHLLHPDTLAAQACEIEIDRLGEPIGKQDQYIAAYGGVTCFRFCRDDKVEAWPLALSQEALYNLEDSLVMFFTGTSRSAAAILKDQDLKLRNGDSDMVRNLHAVKEMGVRSRAALESGRLEEFGAIMHEHWLNKRKRSGGISNSQIDAWYELGLKNGATGGKLMGAGGGGFLLFHAHDKQRLRHAMTMAGLREVRFRFDFEGTKVLSS